MAEASLIFIIIAVVCFSAARAIKVKENDNGFVRFLKFIFKTIFTSIAILLALLVLRVFLK